MLKRTIEEVLEFVQELRRKYAERSDEYSLGSENAYADVELFIQDGTEWLAQERAQQERAVENSQAYQIGYDDAAHTTPEISEYDLEEAKEISWQAGYNEGFADGTSDSDPS